MNYHILTAAESAKFALAKETMLVARSANECIAAAAQLPPLKKLFDDFWFEEELALLVGGAGTGKSLLGLQIADAISKGQPIPGFCMEAEKQKVLYLDTELDDRQLLNWYGGDGDKNAYRFDDNLIRLVVDPGFNDPLFAGTALFAALERVIEEQGIKVLIADSLTGLRNMRNKYRGVEMDLLKFFLELKAKYNLSILVTVPTHQNVGTRIRHLSGRLRDLTTMADSIFAIGHSNNDPDARYLKQLKNRLGRVTYHEQNVAVCKINKGRNHFTGFEFMGYETEQDCLKRGMDALEKAIIAMKEDRMGLSSGEIARKLGTYKMKVWRILQKAELLTVMEYEEEGLEVVWLDEEVDSPQSTDDGGESYQLSVFSNQKEEADSQLSMDDGGESQWSEVGGLGESLEQDVTQDSYQPSAISNQKEEVDGDSQWEVNGPQTTVNRGSQEEENGSELMVDNPLEMQEPCVTTENKLPEEPKEEIDDSDEGAHYLQRHNWKWIR